MIFTLKIGISTSECSQRHLQRAANCNVTNVVVARSPIGKRRPRIVEQSRVIRPAYLIFSTNSKACRIAPLKMFCKARFFATPQQRMAYVNINIIALFIVHSCGFCRLNGANQQKRARNFQLANWCIWELYCECAWVITSGPIMKCGGRFGHVETGF